MPRLLKSEFRQPVGDKPVRQRKDGTQIISGLRIVWIPDELIKRMEGVEDKEAREEEGIKICLEMIEQVKNIEGVAGIHLMPIGWESITPVILERAGLLPRPQV